MPNLYKFKFLFSGFSHLFAYLDVVESFLKTTKTFHHFFTVIAYFRKFNNFILLKLLGPDKSYKIIKLIEHNTLSDLQPSYAILGLLGPAIGPVLNFLLVIVIVETAGVAFVEHIKELIEQDEAEAAALEAERIVAEISRNNKIAVRKKIESFEASNVDDADYF